MRPEQGPTVEHIDALRRLALNAEDDPGLRYLALYSFVDGVASHNHPEVNGRDFATKVRALREDLKGSGRLTPAAERVLGTLQSGRYLAARLRDGADVTTVVTEEEVTAATHTFLSWCRVMGFDDPSLTHIERGLTLWRGGGEKLPARPAPPANSAARGENGAPVTPETTGSATASATLGTPVPPGPFAVPGERAASATPAGPAMPGESAVAVSRGADDEEHREYLARWTAYTRSKGDYERSVMSLSSEQRDTVDRIRSRGDYLITGPPGTGKTVVLLHALDRDLTLADQELGIAPEQPFALVTFTRTLVRFSAYLNRIVGHHRATARIVTVDAFLLDRLKAVRDDGYIVFPSRVHDEFGEILEATAATLRAEVGENDGSAGRAEPGRRQDDRSQITTGMVWREIEEVVFAGHLSREQYVAAATPHSVVAPAVPVQPSDGPLGLPAGSRARETVWDAGREILAVMEERGGYSKHAAARTVAHHLSNEMLLRRIFVDEAQDLAPVDLALLKLLARDGVVVAGDDNQRIYRSGMSFTDVGMAVRGRSRAFRRNYRNTDAIWSLAARYRGGGTVTNHAIRQGPEPELVVVPNYEDGAHAVIRTCRMFMDELGYQPENIAVLASRNEDIKALLPYLAVAKIDTSNVKSTTFDFDKTTGVRLSTMHSSKGVEFPVVIMFLPGFTRRAYLTAAQQDAIERNVIYVAVTRAMDHLHIVVPEPVDHGSIRDLMTTSRRKGG